MAQPNDIGYEDMLTTHPIVRCWLVLAVLSTAAVFVGCQAAPRQHASLAPTAIPVANCNTMPRELSKVILPTYNIEPPDILLIDALHIIPHHPYRLHTLDSINLQVSGTLPDAPISGIYFVEPGGVINLGAHYGTVKITGMTVEEARYTVQLHLRKYLKESMVSLSLANLAARQQIAGEHLVGPDGTVTLGSYGSVCVVGMSIAQAKVAIERHLSQYLEDPVVSVDVFAYNSKVYYVITEGAGLGDGVYRFPITGNETVLDAISQINGLEQVSSKRIWIARPTAQPGGSQMLPVSWQAVTSAGAASTNYQLLPGDRVFIAEDRLVAFDTQIGKLTAPFERILGFALLGTGTTTRLSGPVLRGGGNPRSTF